jgi:RNA polymerase sigma-70 factor (ECF subfamily)
MSWAGRVVYLVALQHRRTRKRDRLQFGEKFFSAMTSVAIREDVSAQLGEQEHALSDCICKLSAEQREMLRAKYAENISVNQMSVMFNRSVEAIYKALNRTRRILHDCVRAKISHGGC